MFGSRRSGVHALAIAGVLALAACSSKSGGTTATGAQTSDTQPPATGSTTTMTTSADTEDTATTAAACGAGGIDDCCCFEVRGAEQPVLGIACVASDAPCEAPQARCPGAQAECEPADLQVTSAEGLECILDALAGAKPARVSWGVTATESLAGSTHNLFIQGDGAAFVSAYTYDDTSYIYGPVERRALQAPGYFAGCLAGSDSERFACLIQATVGAATETCVDGFMGTLD